MKKNAVTLSKDKKIKLIVLSIAIVLTTIGSTYAWWTASTQVKQTVSMGNLKIEAVFDPQESSNYEPGTYAEINGVIKNTGTIPAMVRIDNSSMITFAYSDDQLTPIPETNKKPEAVDGKVVTINYEPQSGSYTDNDQVMWFTNKDGNKYLLMEPRSEVNASIQITFDGPLMTNRYMDSVIDASAQIKATQVMEGAITSEFGVDAADFISLPQTKTANQVTSRLQELLSRGN